jgi:hypothetical protein
MEFHREIRKRKGFSASHLILLLLLSISITANVFLSMEYFGKSRTVKELDELATSRQKDLDTANKKLSVSNSDLNELKSNFTALNQEYQTAVDALVKYDEEYKKLQA